MLPEILDPYHFQEPQLTFSCYSHNCDLLENRLGLLGQTAPEILLKSG